MALAHHCRDRFCKNYTLHCSGPGALTIHSLPVDTSATATLRRMCVITPVEIALSIREHKVVFRVLQLCH